MRVRCFVAMSLLLGWGHNSSADTLYGITELPTLGGVSLPACAGTPYGLTCRGNYGSSINNAGQVTGYFIPAPFAPARAFLYSGGQMRDLGTLGGNYAVGSAINDAGEVVGESGTSSGLIDVPHGFIYSNGVMKDLNSLIHPALGNTVFRATALNNAGQILGWIEAPGSDEGEVSFIYSNGQIQSLGSLAATGINDAGQIVGSVQTPSGMHAALYSNGQTRDLGTLGGFLSSAWAINNSGEVTGQADTSLGNPHAFLYSNGRMADLGALGADDSSLAGAGGINNAGQVVGTNIPSSGIMFEHAFVYSSGQMSDLNDLIDPELGITLSTAIAINDVGQILAINNAIFTGAGDEKSFVLTPVPEPSALALIVFGAIGWACLCRRRNFRTSRNFQETSGKLQQHRPAFFS
jgi:probable HAF family extracellular repeat protein